MITGLAKLDYEVRLEKMDLPSLAFRRARGDAIETYKFLHGIYKVDSSSMLPLHTTDGITTIGHSLKLQKRNYKTQLRKNFFGLRMINSWNHLPETIVQASSVNVFKGLYDRHFVDQGWILVLDRSTGCTAYEGSNMMMMMMMMMINQEYGQPTQTHSR
jgi:hypothetical protein